MPVWEGEILKMGRKRRKKKNKVDEYVDPYPEMDDTFAYIDGYTSWGFAYGVTWEEIGIDPELPFEEKVRLYLEQSRVEDNHPEIEDEELPFD